MGVLEKVYLEWDQIWWPIKYGAFWRVRDNESFGKSTAIEFYNLAQLNATHPAAVLLATPAGGHCVMRAGYLYTHITRCCAIISLGAVQS